MGNTTENLMIRPGKCFPEGNVPSAIGNFDNSEQNVQFDLEKKKKGKKNQIPNLTTLP